MTDTPQAPTPVPSPEERSSFNFGLWALLLNLLCGCFPVAIVLGILAITKHNKAKAAAAAEPQRYAAPASTGLVLGIVGIVLTFFALVYIGIVSAIAIPALLGQRGRARDRASAAQMVTATADLAMEFDRLRIANAPMGDIPKDLETQLRMGHGVDKNPWNPAAPAYDFHIHLVTGLDRGGVEAAAEDTASSLGQPVFVLELPTDRQPGFLAGAVRTQMEVRGGHVQAKVVELE